MRDKIKTKLGNIPYELKLFFAVIFLFGIGGSMVDAVFNKFLSEKLLLNGFQRSVIEFPREIPGFLTAFISAILFFLYSRRVAAVTFLLQSVGIICMALFSVNFAVTMIWLFIFSMGQHLFIPLNSSIAMELAKDNEMGKRLGQVNGIKNTAVIIGGAVVFIGFKYINFSFKITFIIAGVIFVVS